MRSLAWRWLGLRLVGTLQPQEGVRGQAESCGGNIGIQCSLDGAWGCTEEEEEVR